MGLADTSFSNRLKQTSIERKQFVLEKLQALNDSAKEYCKSLVAIYPALMLGPPEGVRSFYSRANQLRWAKSNTPFNKQNKPLINKDFLLAGDILLYTD